jgi:hypothetical protein
MRIGNFGNPFGFSRENERASGVPALRADVDEVVGVGDDVEIVFDGDDGIPFLDETVQDVEELGDVGKMESGRRFVQNIEGFGGRTLREVERELYALRFASGKGRCRLSEGNVSETDVDEHLKYPRDSGKRRKEREGFLAGHRKHFGDGFSFEFDFERFGIVPASLAGFAFDVHVREEVHFNLLHSRAFAYFATSALGVERKPSRSVSAFFRFEGGGEHLPYVGEKPRVGGNVGMGRASDGRLVDDDGFVQVVHSPDFPAFPRIGKGVLPKTPKYPVSKDIHYERRFSGTRNARDRRKDSEGDFHVEVFQIVLACAKNFNVSGGSPVPFRKKYPLSPREIGSGFAIGRPYFVERSRKHDLSPVLSGTRTDVDDVVGGLHDVFVVFDDDDGIADFGELFQIGDEKVVIAGMQAYGRLVQDVDDAFEAGSDLSGQPDALGFSSRKGVRAPRERHVVETHPRKEFEAFDDVFLNVPKNFLPGSRKGKPAKEFERPADRKIGNLADMESPDFHRKVFALETVPVAFGTIDFGNVLGNTLHIRVFGFRFAVSARQIRNHPLVFGSKGLFRSRRIFFEFVKEFVGFARGSVKDFFPRARHQASKRSVHVDLEALAHGSKNRRVVGMGRPRKYRSFRKRKPGVDDVFFQKSDFGSESVATRASAMVRIETEIGNGKVGNLVVTLGTRAFFAEAGNGSGREVLEKTFAVSGLVGEFDAVAEPFFIFFEFLARSVFRDQTVDHEICPVAR